ncbi:bifunctional Peptidase C19 [Babesia duncani]|uniref:Bifunctional Peptidase C19 n=1 Tax=Babesia duncani TaxID=323732 RepID=A0AAD9UN22_9APIC|nr:bifunctional Peptidase C19 [Babesia duncani]
MEGYTNETDSLNRTSNENMPPSDAKRQICPYLGTINRHMLDFDFEKVCSITMSSQHVYACLVCGKYFQGRGKNTHCYTHALQQGHFVFMNLQDCQVYCLPENYLVDDTSLDDIKSFLRPTFSISDVESIDTTVRFGKALDGTDFIPGCVGLNNLKMTDCFNVVIQALCTIAPLRNHLLLLNIDAIQPPDPIVTTLVELVRKIFNQKNFKGIVSPHELLQYDYMENLGKARMVFSFSKCKNAESIVSKTLGGQLIVRNCFAPESKPIIKAFRYLFACDFNFRMLTLDIPAVPIFKDSNERSVIPQVPIFELLEKFNGTSEHATKDGPCTYKIYKLPQYLIFHLKRFAKNNFFLEKNGTIVPFPMKNLDLAPYLDETSPHLKRGVCTKYDLVANICHHGTPTGGSFKIHVLHAPLGDWYEIEDLLVNAVLPHMSTNDDFDLYGDLEGFAEPLEPFESQSKESQTVISRTPGQYDESGKDSGYSDTEQEPDSEEDEIVLLVNDEDVPEDASGTGIVQSSDAKSRHWNTTFRPRERVIYIGAPATVTDAPKIECLCLVGKVPWYMDQVTFIERSPQSSRPIFVCFCSSPSNGISMGIGLVEFESPEVCMRFQKSQSQFSTMPLSPEIFQHVENGQYRHGIISRKVHACICAKFDITIPSDSLHLDSELEFEQQQLKMIENGDYNSATKMFPWFNINLIPLICKNKANQEKKDEIDITNHLEAYKMEAQRQRVVSTSNTTTHSTTTRPIQMPPLVVPPLLMHPAMLQMMQQQHKIGQIPKTSSGGKIHEKKRIRDKRKSSSHGQQFTSKKSKE